MHFPRLLKSCDILLPIENLTHLSTPKTKYRSRQLGSKAVQFKKLCKNISVPSSNIRSKRSHREHAIKRHIGRILPDLRGINQASGRENLMGFHKGKGTRRRIFHIIWSCNSVSCAYQNRL
jgi:hypothetical protein